MVENKQTTTAKKEDYGIIHQAFLFVANKWKQYQGNRLNKKVAKLITQAEALSKETGYRYYVVRFKGKIRIIPKQTFKLWIRQGTIKKGVSIQDIEAKVYYVTKLKMTCSSPQQN